MKFERETEWERQEGLRLQEEYDAAKFRRRFWTMLPVVLMILFVIVMIFLPK